MYKNESYNETFFYLLILFLNFRTSIKWDLKGVFRFKKNKLSFF